MGDWRTIADIRREYGDLSLNEDAIDNNPIGQFKRWFEEVAPEEKTDPTAMLLSTVDEKGHPDSRVVLLKGLNDDGFIFYTNYKSTKAIQISHNPYVALNFYWPQMSRQVRIRGQIKQVAQAQSDAYFASRPITSQFSAILSPQSQEIRDRNELEQRLNQLIAEHGQEPIVRPRHWGGYVVAPFEMEFWQGRDNRLHDRILYYKKDEQWTYRRLAP